MGLAKYMEDNIEIFNHRMFKKEIKLVELKNFKKAQKRKSNLISVEEEYLLVLKALEKIERFLNIIDNAEEIIRSEFVFKTMYKQKKQLNKVKNEYIDYKFDSKFKSFRHKSFNISDKELKVYQEKIIKSYIQYFLENLKVMENHTNDDAIAINFLYWDIKQFINKFLNIDTSKIKIPLVQYIREYILKDDEKAWVRCSNCGERTYKDFNTCICCRYPNEVI